MKHHTDSTYLTKYLRKIVDLIILINETVLNIRHMYKTEAVEVLNRFMYQDNDISMGVVAATCDTG